jgi:hypothetical protein
MKPAIVFPFHDPDGVMYPHLKSITPILKQTFSEAFLSITPITKASSPENVEQLKRDNFFKLFFLEKDLTVGKHFLSLYEFATRSCSSQKVLHLCFIDRVVFALRTNHQTQFIEDVTTLNRKSSPVIFQRSAKAWNTHPRNYYEIEKFITTIGELVLGQSLDFAWCHLVIRSSQLADVLPHVQSDDWRMVAELILLIRSGVTTQDVDWLEWEDPFFSPYGAAELKRIREENTQETQKRLSYAIPMVQKILEHSDQ